MFSSDNVSMLKIHSATCKYNTIQYNKNICIAHRGRLFDVLQDWDSSDKANW